MYSVIEAILQGAADKISFWILQGVVLATFLLALVKEWIARRRSGKGGATLIVTWGEGTMAKFYGAYLTASGLLVSICLSTDVIAEYRVFWVVFDSAVVLYLCLLNPWFRNNLILWSNSLAKFDSR
jgi:hypothetical protein